jgi:hypothetical protein
MFQRPTTYRAGLGRLGIKLDVATKQLWSVEDNFNNQIMGNQRNFYLPWMHGHLFESQPI